MLSKFLYTCCPFVCLLWKHVYSISLPIFKSVFFFFLLLSCLGSLYILNINPLLDTLFANSFPHFISLISLISLAAFLFCGCFFYCAKVFQFHKVPLADFCFCVCTFGVIAKESFLSLMSRSFSICFLLGIL